MTKLLLITLCLTLCSCIVRYDRNDPIDCFPKENSKKSISLIINKTQPNEILFEKAKETYKKHFEKSDIFSKVILDNGTKTDYTLFITDTPGGSLSVHQMLSCFLSGCTWGIFPCVANNENARYINLKLTDNLTKKEQNNYHIEGMWMSTGVFALFAMPFTDNIFNAEKRTYDNVVLRTYYMIKAFE